MSAALGPGASTVIPPSAPAYLETKDQAVEREEHELLEYLEAAGRQLRDAGLAVHTAILTPSAVWAYRTRGSMTKTF